jgi:hypothetical protein
MISHAHIYLGLDIPYLHGLAIYTYPLKSACSAITVHSYLLYPLYSIHN